MRFVALREVLQPLVSLAIGLAVVTLVVAAQGHDPLALFGAALAGAVLTKTGALQVLASAVPLTLASLAFAVSMRTGLFNIGAEGAILVGGAASIAVGGVLTLPAGMHLAVTMLCAAAAGFAWMVPAAMLKSRRGVHEVVTTIMMNYIALYLVSFLVAGPLRDYGSTLGTFAYEVKPGARFPLVSGPLTWAWLAAVLVPALAYFVVWHTRHGAHMRATGFNVSASHQAGIDTDSRMTLAFGLGGAAAGLAGCVLTAGLPPDWTTNDELVSLQGFGYLGIAVAMIGRNHPLGCVVAALLVGVIRTCRFSFQQMGVAPEITDILIGVVIVSFAFPEIAGRLTAFAAQRAGASRVAAAASAASGGQAR